MLINSFASTYNQKYNSCGIGINETIERSKFKQLCINMRSIIDWGPSKLVGVLEKIDKEYVPWRLEKLGLPKDEFNEYFSQRITDPARVIEQYINVIKFMLNHVYIWHDSDLIDRFVDKSPKDRHVVFEGAQGMRLDQNRTELMPFLTRSNTGTKNVLSIIKDMKNQVNLEVIPVTRTYITRHGEGPIKNEFELPFAKIEEIANPFNKYQGNMRYGLFDFDWYCKAIDEIRKQMFNKPPENIKEFKISIALNCQDHLDLGDLEDLGHELKYISTGPTEKDIKLSTW
jgi:adenylosuccinate synthase